MSFFWNILIALWGSRYRLHAVTLLICSSIVFYCWARGYREVEQFAADPVLSWTALLGSIVGLIYVLFWRSKAAGYLPTRKFRRELPGWALSVAFLVFGGVLRFYSYQYGVWGSFKEGEIGILVGAIPADQNRTQQNSYINAIRSLVVEDATLRDAVKVWPLYREFPSNPDQQQEQALRLAQRLRASFVIRPVAEAGGHRPWLTIAGQPEFPRAEVALGKVTNLAELDRMALPKDVTLLARCAVALSFYSRGQYPQAAQQFTQILGVATLPDAAPARPYLNFLLGNAYRELPGPNRSANLQEAIRSYNLALEVSTRERYPTDWAATMNNLGAAYWELQGPNREENLRKAIHCFEEALEVRTRERYPTQWAMTMNNRGNAYGELLEPDRAANLKEAIRCFEEALAVFEEQGMTHYTEIARQNLARARSALAQLTGLQ